MDNKKINCIKLSVCMITFNHELYIQEAIESILMQKCNFDFELIIGEDCSNDKTRQICQHYARKYSEIKLLTSEINLGMMPNFIRTLRACTGKYIALCEGDDYWIDPYKLQKQVDFLEANHMYSISFHNVKIWENGKITDDFFTREVPETTGIMDLAEGNYIHTPSVVFRNKLFDQFPEQFQQAPIGDYFLHMLNAKYGKIKKLSEKMGVYRVHLNGMHSLKSSIYKDQQWITLLNYMIPCFEGNVKQKLQDNLLSFAKNFLLYDNVSSNEVIREIQKYIIDYEPMYFLDILKQNELQKKQMNSGKRALKIFLSKIIQKIVHRHQIQWTISSQSSGVS